MTFLIVFLIFVLAYVAYINRDRIKAALNKDDGLDVEPTVTQILTSVPNIGATVPNTGTVVPNSAPTPGTITATFPIYNGVGDPPSQEAWTAWLATLNPMTRSHYPAIWRPVEVQATGSGDRFPNFSPAGPNLITNDMLKRGERNLATGTLGVVMAFPVEPGATRVTISETSGTGDRVQYNLWISKVPVGISLAGVPSHPFQYNAATVIFTPSEGIVYANVRALVDGGRPFYIQAN